MKRVLLISNRVMHYRVSVYNYFASRFRECGWELLVRSNELQKESPYPLRFDFREMEFDFRSYKREIARIDPHAVIIFLHLKDVIIWPLVHWLKLKGIPVAFWTKGANLDAPNDRVSYVLYRYMHFLSDAIVLYSGGEIGYVSERYRHKVFIANNTVNFADFPEIEESRDEIKKELGIPFEKIVLSVGRMGEGAGRKKVDQLIEIFRELDVEGIGLVIVGSGMSGKLLGRMNKNNTIYLGEVYDRENLQISKIFKMADIFSIPGHVGLGLNQAFYWGLPVVTSEGLQPPEIHYLRDGRNGFMVPNDDLSALKERILYLLKDDHAREAFSRMAREDILREASIENMFEGFQKCVEYLSGR